MTSDSTGLHFDASLSKAKSCFGDDLWLFELKILDFKEPACSALGSNRGAAS